MGTAVALSAAVAYALGLEVLSGSGGFAPSAGGTSGSVADTLAFLALQGLFMLAAYIGPPLHLDWRRLRLSRQAAAYKFRELFFSVFGPLLIGLIGVLIFIEHAGPVPGLEIFATAGGLGWLHALLLWGRRLTRPPAR